MIQNLELILIVSVSLFTIRSNLGEMFVHIFRRDEVDAEIEAHERTEETQKNTIEALKERLFVIEQEISGLKQELSQERKENIKLRTENGTMKRTIRGLRTRVVELERLFVMGKENEHEPSE